MKFRIVQINDRFVVQCKDTWISSWRGVDAEKGLSAHWGFWISLEHQYQFCSWSTLSKAKKFKSEVESKTYEIVKIFDDE